MWSRAPQVQADWLTAALFQALKMLNSHQTEIMPRPFLSLHADLCRGFMSCCGSTVSLEAAAVHGRRAYLGKAVCRIHFSEQGPKTMRNKNRIQHEVKAGEGKRRELLSTGALIPEALLPALHI